MNVILVFRLLTGPRQIASPENTVKLHIKTQYGIKVEEEHI